MALQEKDKKIILIFVVIFFLGGGWYLYDSIIPAYQALDGEIVDKRKKIDEARDQIKNLNKLRYEISELDNELKILKNFFPEEADGASKARELQPKIEMMGQRLGIKFRQLSFQAELEHEGGLYKEIPMLIEPSEPLKIDLIIKLLYAFEKYENILDVTQFIIVPANETKDLFSVSMNVSFYIFRKNAFNLDQK